MQFSVIIMANNRLASLGVGTPCEILDPPILPYAEVTWDPIPG